MCESKKEMEYSLPRDGVFARVERVLHRKSQRALGCLGALPSMTPFQVGYYRNAEFAARLDDLLPSHDGVLAHLIRTGDYLADCGLPKILEMTDALSLTYRRGAELNRGNRLSAVAYRWEARRLIRYERAIIKNFDMSVLVSAVDRDFLLPGDDGERIEVCPNGVDTQELPFSYSPDRKTIVFIGNNTALHNSDGILYFTKEIFPMVRARCPESRFKIIGRMNDRLQRKLEREPQVVVTGAVGSIVNAARGASVGVCPVRFGAGVQNKMLEYLSLGIPAVTSTIGLEGLTAEDRLHLLVARSPQEWTDRICELLENPARGYALARAGRELVEQQYSWSSLMIPLRRRICELLSGDRRTDKSSIVRAS
jgi:glycosyltransferase involved in cell wall biosynthesis